MSTIAAFVTAGPLPLAAADEGTREEERRSAERALDEAAASLDATAIALLSGLPGTTGERIHALLASSRVGQATFDEVAIGTGGLPGGAPASRREEAVYRAMQFAARLTLTSDTPGGPAGSGDQHLIEMLADRSSAPGFRGLVSAVNVALAHEIPLYSDDRAVRRLARGLGLPAFGTVALLEALVRRGHWTAGEALAVRAELAARGAWGLGQTPQELIDGLRARGWQWDTGAAASFSDLLAHSDPPSGLMVHMAETLIAVAMEDAERLPEWAHHLVTVFAESLGLSAAAVVRTILVRVTDLAAPADPEHDAARARVVRALRTIPEFTGAFTDLDPLIRMVNEWLQLTADERVRASILRTVLRQVDAQDRALLTEAFVRD
jgi:hypothetical protein